MDIKLRYDTARMNKRDKALVRCKYNEGILCTSGDKKDEWVCEHCGWNPAEAARRKDEVKLRVLVPDSDTWL